MKLKSRQFLMLYTAVCLLICLSVSKAAVIYVDADVQADHDGQSWNTAFHKLQDALTAATEGDEIRIAQGKYKPDETALNPEGTGDRIAAFTLNDGISLFGGYAGLSEPDPNSRDTEIYETVLSGDLDDNDTELSNASQLINDPNRSENSYHVISIFSGTAIPVLDGLTITGGMANGIDLNLNGGGILVISSSPSISNCRFEYNAAINGGAIYNLTSNPRLLSCTFLRNYAQNAGGGLRNITSSNPEISHCTLIENKASGFGGGMANSSNSSPTVIGTTFSYNWSNHGGGVNNYDFSSPQFITSKFFYNASDSSGGALSNQNHSDTELINCGLYSNTAPFGAGLYNYQSDPKMVDCVASGNVAVESGGVLYNRDAIDVRVTNCTFVSNTAAVLGPSLYNNEFSSTTIQNSILWDAIGTGQNPIYSESDPSSISVNYCCVQGGWTSGTGNIDTDPMFVDPNGLDGIIGTDDDNLKLLTESSCIDAGDNTAVPADDFDLDNDTDTLERIPLDHNGKARFLNILDIPDTGLADPPGYPDIVDMGAFEKTRPILVDILAPGPDHDGTIWEKAFMHPQDALAVAEKGDMIFVAQGSYCPDPNKTNQAAAFELVEGVIIRGGYAGLSQADPNVRDVQTYTTILSGDLLGNDSPLTDPADIVNDSNRSDNSYHVLTAHNISDNTELSGFIITGGMALGVDPENSGGGIRMDSSNPVISDCYFEYNAAEYGGAIYSLSSNAIFNQCSFFRNYAVNHGGGLRNYSSSSPELSNCTLDENKASGYGGAMANSNSSSPILMQCAFSNNWSNQGGAAINNYGYCSPKLTQSVFEYNAANNTGGAIRNENDSDTESINCHFAANTAVSGGAIYSTASDPTVTDCNFIDNTTTENGGAIYGKDGSLGVQNCTFLTNQSDNLGGGLYADALASLNVIGCEFKSNTGLSGGAIYNTASDPTVSDCNFIDNTTTVNGGAIYSKDGSLGVQNCTFLTNQSDNLGGGLYADTLTSLNVIGCEFKSNTGLSGGAIYNDLSEPTITNCDFSDNISAYNGGAIYSTNGTLILQISTFSTNYSDNYGGAVYSVGSEPLDIEKCTFTSNTGIRGGAVFCDNSSSTVTRSTFLNNMTINSDDISETENGGAIYNESEILAISHSTFLANDAYLNGGAVFNMTGSLTLEDSIVRNNQSGKNGAGICSLSSDMLTLTSSILSSNTTVYDGGGLYLHNISDIDLFNCLITNNNADYGGGIANTGTSSASLLHCTLSDNTAAIGDGIYNSGLNTVIENSILLDGVVPPSAVTVDFSCIPGWTGSGTGNIADDPAFVDSDGQDNIPGTDDDNFRLASNSPCLNVADNSSIPVDLETDLEGHPRIVDGNCSGQAIADMGSYEFSTLSMGDFDMSCSINLADFIDFAAAWMTAEGDVLYNASCDLNHPPDKVINAEDLAVFSQNWLHGIE